MITTLLKRANVYLNNTFNICDLLVKDGIVSVASGVIDIDNITIIDCDDLFILPGFVDVHVHLRDPGFCYKENMKTGTMAAAKGGFTTIASMPNLNPVPDCIENLNIQQQIINQNAVIEVIPYCSITKSQKGLELVDFDKLKDMCIGFSDDGCGVQQNHIMEQAMELAKKANMPIVAHCEDESLLHGGYIHDGEYAKLNNHQGICSESEYIQVARDIELVRKTGVQYHICHISTKETVELVRNAKKEGLNITCETAPHYIAFNDSMLQDDGRFKMNPPIRSTKDQKALIEGVIDGTIDIIATDHAPHSFEEKSKGLKGSNMGVVGLETAFSAIYTHLVKTELITMERLVDLMCNNPRKIFNLKPSLQPGELADLVIVDIHKKNIVNTKQNVSMGLASPFNGEELYGEVVMTIHKGEIVWQNNLIEKSY